eukprot:3190890-Amphidinium_carterae.1
MLGVVDYGWGLGGPCVLDFERQAWTLTALTVSNSVTNRPSKKHSMKRTDETIFPSGVSED